MRVYPPPIGGAALGVTRSIRRRGRSCRASGAGKKTRASSEMPIELLVRRATPDSAHTWFGVWGLGFRVSGS